MSLNTEENRDETTQEQVTPTATPRMNINTKNRQTTEVSLVDFRRQLSFQGSPRSQKALGNPSSARCLCSPTTHVGSFRCRHHRNRGLGMSRAASLGSNLALLGTKSGPVSESKLNGLPF